MIAHAQFYQMTFMGRKYHSLHTGQKSAFCTPLSVLQTQSAVGRPHLSAVLVLYLSPCFIPSPQSVFSTDRIEKGSERSKRTVNFDRTGPTEKSGPPRKVYRLFRNFCGWTAPIHSDRNFRKFWLNGSRPGSEPRDSFPTCAGLPFCGCSREIAK